MDAQGIIALRKAAAAAIGIKAVDGRAFTGIAGDYASLTPADQIRVSDKMAEMIANDPDPSKYTAIQLDVARKRVSSPLYGQPLQATSYIAITGELIKSGEMQDLLLGSASKYINQVTGTALLALGLGLGAFLIWKDSQRRRA